MVARVAAFLIRLGEPPPPPSNLLTSPPTCAQVRPNPAATEEAEDPVPDAGLGAGTDDEDGSESEGAGESDELSSDEEEEAVRGCQTKNHMRIGLSPVRSQPM
jgi:hypothetical protein